MEPETAKSISQCEAVKKRGVPSPGTRFTKDPEHNVERPVVRLIQVIRPTPSADDWNAEEQVTSSWDSYEGFVEATI